jgi:CHAT domain-containing protein
MKLIGFLLVLFVGMSGVSYGQIPDIPNPKESFKELLEGSDFKAAHAFWLKESITQDQMVDSLYEISKKAFQIQSPLPLEFHQKLSYLVKSQKGEYSREYAEVIHNIARKYAEVNDDNTGLLYNLYALKIRQKSLPKKDVDIARSHNNIGLIYHYLNDIDKARDHYLKAVQYANPNYGQLNNLFFMNALNLFLNLGDNEKTLSLVNQYEKIYETYPLLYSHLYNSYWSLCIWLGNDDVNKLSQDESLILANKLFIQLEKILYSNLNKFDEISTYRLKHHKAITLINIQDNVSVNNEALRIFQEVQSKLEDKGYDESPLYFRCLRNMAFVYDRLSLDYKAFQIRTLATQNTLGINRQLNEDELLFLFDNLENMLYSHRDYGISFPLAQSAIKLLYGNGLTEKAILLQYRLINISTKELREHDYAEDLLRKIDNQLKTQKEGPHILGLYDYHFGNYQYAIGASDYLFYWEKAKEILDSTSYSCSGEYNTLISQIIRFYNTNRKEGEIKIIEDEYLRCKSCFKSPENQEVVDFTCKNKYFKAIWDAAGFMEVFYRDKEIWHLLKSADTTFEHDQRLYWRAIESIWDLEVYIHDDSLLFELNKRIEKYAPNLYLRLGAQFNIMEYYYSRNELKEGDVFWKQIDTLKNTLPKGQKSIFETKLLIAKRQPLKMQSEKEFNLDSLISSHPNYFLTYGKDILSLIDDKREKVKIIEDAERLIVSKNGWLSKPYYDFIDIVLQVLKEDKAHGEQLLWMEKKLKLNRKLYPSDTVSQMLLIRDVQSLYSKLNNFTRPHQLMKEFQEHYHTTAKSLSMSLKTSSLIYYRSYLAVSVHNQMELINKYIHDENQEAYARTCIITIKLLEIYKEHFKKLKNLRKQKKYSVEDDKIYLGSCDFEIGYLDMLISYIKNNERDDNIIFNFFRNDSTIYEMFPVSRFVPDVDSYLVNEIVYVLYKLDSLNQLYGDRFMSNDSIVFHAENTTNAIRKRIKKIKKDLTYLPDEMSFSHKDELIRCLSDYYWFFFPLPRDLPINKKESIIRDGFELKINIDNLISSYDRLLNNYLIKDTITRRLYYELDSLRSKYYFSDLPSDSMRAIKDSIHSRELNFRFRIAESNIGLEWIEIKDLENSLKNDEAYIDLITLVPTFGDDRIYQNYYLVNTVLPNSVIKTPMQRITNGDALMELSHDYANRIHGNSTLRKMTDTSGRYYDQFWRPIAKELKGIDKVYISLSGVYNNINLATLYNKETGKYLFEELDIEIVNSARSFIESKNKAPEQYEDLTATLIGYADYDHKPNVEKLLEMKEDYYASSRDITAQRTDSLSRGGRVGSLPGTKVEVETIAETLRKQKWTPTVLMESNASEHAVKRLKSPRIVHMATHGYFLEDIEPDHEEERMLGMDRTKVVENPMLRSGLLFAGANATLSGKEEQEGENGILTAYEASFLNLENTELVVMSACETARGEQKTGEGVYGLRKAIADAGAEYVMMSLWKVDDKVTQEFMTTFYTYWLEDKMPIREAFKSTRSFIKSKYPQPYYWGAFILVGR